MRSTQAKHKHTGLTLVLYEVQTFIHICWTLVGHLWIEFGNMFYTFGTLPGHIWKPFRNVFVTCWTHVGGSFPSCWTLSATCFTLVVHLPETCLILVGHLLGTCWTPSGDSVHSFQTAWNSVLGKQHTCKHMTRTTNLTIHTNYVSFRNPQHLENLI